MGEQGYVGEDIAVPGGSVPVPVPATGVPAVGAD
jgi:hypothetical protein